MEYILYCDESSDKGEKYGDFFGGCLVSSQYLNEVISALENKKRELNLNKEIKWTKVTENYLSKYEEMMDLFFYFIKQGKLKVRIMFRNMDDIPKSETVNNSDDKYFKLYYQFIKHAFGFRYIPDTNEPVFLRIYLDQLPDKKEKCDKFKNFLLQLPSTLDFKNSNIKIRKDDIAEVASHEHIIIQCTDIILGSMYFRLNNHHQIIPEGKKRRGKRTIAKEKLYNHINKKIREIMPGFNIGVNTGDRNSKNPRWEQPYRHWRFIPK